jgi:hypothetical protein
VWILSSLGLLLISFVLVIFFLGVKSSNNGGLGSPVPVEVEGTSTLNAIVNAQIAYFQVHGVYTTDLDALKVTPPTESAAVTIRVPWATKQGYCVEATNGVGVSHFISPNLKSTETPTLTTGPCPVTPPVAA